MSLTVATDPLTLTIVMFFALYGVVSFWQDVRGFVKQRRALRQMRNNTTDKG